VYSPACSGCPSTPYASYNSSASSSSIQYWCSYNSAVCGNCPSPTSACAWTQQLDDTGESFAFGYLYRDQLTIGGLTARGRVPIGGIYKVRNPSRRIYYLVAVELRAGNRLERNSLTTSQLLCFRASSHLVNPSNLKEFLAILE
jgi:hypothetical protein